jgi:ketosteroid isomerase-like protein
MSPKSSDVVRAYFDAFGPGGRDAVARFWDPAIEWRVIGAGPRHVSVIRGRDAMRRHYDDWVETIDDLRAVVAEVLFEDGERVAALVRNSGRGRGSGANVDSSFYVACVVRDGRIVVGHEYTTREQAIDGVRRLA